MASDRRETAGIIQVMQFTPHFWLCPVLLNLVYFLVDYSLQLLSGEILFPSPVEIVMNYLVLHYEKQRKELDAERARERASMIGSGGRAEQIRTYRFKENLAVDHRLGRSFNLGELMQGRMTPMIEALIELDVARRLAAL